MFTGFFYRLRDRGIPVSPTSFLRLQRALQLQLVSSLEDFYVVCRAILIKSERYFDMYDRVFAASFQGITIEEPQESDLAEVIRALLDGWLKRPDDLAQALGLDDTTVARMSPEELLQHFLKLIREQKEAHHGGNRWIGTGGTAPVGHSGFHPGGMRIGGTSRNKSAVKVAGERRYRDYNQEGPLTAFQLGEALKRLKRMIPAGPRDLVNVEATIRQTIRSAGEIEIIFDRRLTDRLKVILLIDNGGWSMDAYVGLVQTLFHYARSHFKELTVYYFHNSIYSHVWQDPQRHRRPEPVDDFIRKDPESRLIIVGDASMAPYELLQVNGAILLEQSRGRHRPSIDRLRFLAGTFRHCVWLNPQPEEYWGQTYTIGLIRQIFPMFALTLEGLDRAAEHLIRRQQKGS